MRIPPTGDTSAMAWLRCQTWGFFAAAMEYPEEELIALIRDGAVMRQARQLMASLHPQLDAVIDWPALAAAAQGDALAIEYTRLFDTTGPSGTACPLNSGILLGDDGRMKLLEELVRFYNYFGLTAAGAPANELPDHLGAQLDFLNFLCAQEAQCLEAGEVADDYRRAQRDFLQRHPGRWASPLAARLQGHQARRYYAVLLDLLERFVALEQLALEQSPGLPLPAPTLRENLTGHRI